MQHLLVPVCYVVKSFEVLIPVLMLKTYTQISYTPVVQACHDFKILRLTSKGEQMNFKFMFIQ